MDPTPRQRTWRENLSGDWEFARRVLIAIGLAGLAYFLWSTAGVLLLVFAAILLSVVFHALASLLRTYAHIPGNWALVAAVALVAGLFGGLIYLFGSQVSGQISAVVLGLPEALDNLGRQFGIEDASGRLEESLAENVTATSLLPRAAGWGYTLVEGIANLVVVVIAAIYLAAEPRLYQRGVVKLFPPNQHERVLDTLETVGNALRLWFVGQLIVMVVLGTLSALGYWWLGLPAPAALGLIAGITNFIPFLGPVIGALPAVIFAFNIDMTTVLWTIGLVIAIQQIESDIVTPLVQRRTVSLPPALALFTIIVFGLMFGFLGVFLAVPLTVAIYVVVKKLYVRETLGERTEVPGEDKSKPAAEAERREGPS